MSDVELSDVSEEEVPAPQPSYDHAEVPPPFRAFIRGLSRHTAQPQLTKFLAEVDPDVSHVHLAVEKGEKPWCRGFAHCSFSTDSLRQRAIAQLTGRTFNGKKVTIEEAGEHFMARRRREEGDEAGLRERGPLKRDLNAAAAAERGAVAQARRDAKTNPQQSWDNNNSSWDSWGGNNDWNNRVAAGTQKRWDPTQAAAAAPQGSKKKQELEAKKAQAVANEDYEAAARIKKQIDALAAVEGKIEKLQAEKKAAVEREDFAAAGELKKQIEAIENGATEAKPAAPAPVKKAAPVEKKPVAAEKKAAEKEAAPAAEKKAGGCKRCDSGKPCGKHGADAQSRCKKCQAKQACLKHNPSADTIMELQKQAQARLEKQQNKGGKRKLEADGDDNDAPAPKKAAKAKTPPTQPAAAAPAASKSFMACMDEDM